MKKTDPEQWDVSDDDDEDEEELGDSESIEKQEKLSALPDLNDFVDVKNEAKISDDGLVKTLKNFLDSNKISSEASDSSDFSNDMPQVQILLASRKNAFEGITTRKVSLKLRHSKRHFDLIKLFVVG